MEHGFLGDSHRQKIEKEKLIYHALPPEDRVNYDQTHEVVTRIIHGQEVKVKLYAPGLRYLNKPKTWQFGGGTSTVKANGKVGSVGRKK